jgi:glutathione S-transferase
MSPLPPITTEQQTFQTVATRIFARKFRTEFDARDALLPKHPYLMGDSITVLDITWFIYAHQLSLGGYPFARLHPRVSAWVDKLRTRPEFSKEIAMPAEAVTRLENARRALTLAGKTLEAVAEF